MIPYDPEKDQKSYKQTERSYLDFLEKMNPEWLNGIAYARLVNLNLIRFNGAEPAILRSEAVNLSTYPVNPDKTVRDIFRLPMILWQADTLKPCMI